MCNECHKNFVISSKVDVGVLAEKGGEGRRRVGKVGKGREGRRRVGKVGKGMASPEARQSGVRPGVRK